MPSNTILGHAGAGTVMEALGLKKPLLVVINLALMNNHQVELAERLAVDGHLIYTHGTNALAKTLLKPELFQLKPLPKANTTAFSRFMDNFLVEN